ncbi:hypothetical protein BD779DRAFT_1553988 [Infundibulicybe gibba]|nr:hypothetical protein BD779DRAFT_1553988 [Infundibulicybe gibba]
MYYTPLELPFPPILRRASPQPHLACLVRLTQPRFGHTPCPPFVMTPSSDLTRPLPDRGQHTTPMSSPAPYVKIQALACISVCM